MQKVNLFPYENRETPVYFLCISFHFLARIASVFDLFPLKRWAKFWKESNIASVCKKILEWTENFLLRSKMVTLFGDLWQFPSEVHHVITQSHLLWTKSLSGMVLLQWKWMDVLALKCHHCPLWEWWTRLAGTLASRTLYEPCVFWDIFNIFIWMMLFSEKSYNSFHIHREKVNTELA